MTRRLLFVTSLALSLLCRDAAADFSFVHLSDTHVSHADGEGSNAHKDAELFKEIAALNPKPAFVINTGDVCEIGTPREYDIWRSTLKSLFGVPIHVAPGNHDVRWNPLGKEGFRLGTGQPLYQSWDHDNVHFVLLDPTVLLQHWGHVSQAQLDWLKTDLDRIGPDRPVVIGFHHWIGRESVQVDNEQALLDVVAPYNVRLWLQGHGHSDIQWSINGAPAMMAKGLYQGSYHVIDVTKDVMKLRRRSLGAPPGGNEIIRDKNVPQGQRVTWTDVMTIPLARQPALQWQALAAVENGVALVTATLGGDAKPRRVEFRLNAAKYSEMTKEDHVWQAAFPTPELVPGVHQVTVQVTLAEGRQYQKPAPFTVPSAATTGARVDALWSANVGGAVQSHILRHADALYVTTMGNDLVVLDPATGKQQWKFTAGDSIFSSPHVHEGAVYFGSADHHVYAIDLATRQPRWKFRTQGAVLATPALARGTLCVASVDQTIYGLDASTGQPVWRVQGQNMFQSKIATDGRRFFVGGWDNSFRAIDGKSGEVLWDKKVGRDAKSGKIVFYYSPAIASPAVAPDLGLVYVTSNDGVLHAFDTDTGGIRWEYDGKKLGYSSPLYHQGRVYCAIGDDGQVFCFDAKTGQRLWQTPTHNVIYDSSAAYANGKIFIAAVNGTFNALDAATGRLLWQYRLGPGHVFASPAADADRVYIGSLIGQVTALPAK